MLRLVYGCLAISAAALLALVIASSGEDASFAGTTKPMFEALTDDAKVLAADRNGAVTQTGNGRIAGHRRGTRGAVWTLKFNPFAEADRDPWGGDAIQAVAWCAGGCPAAIVTTGAGFSAQAGADPALAKSLAARSSTPGTALQVIAVTARDTAYGFIDSGPAHPAPLLEFKGTRIRELPVDSPSTVMTDDRGTRLAAGSPKGESGALARLQRSAGRWAEAAPSFEEPLLRNLCISRDGRWLGAVSARILMMGFSGGEPIASGDSVASGTCTADSGGFTAVVNPSARPGVVAVVRYTHDGRRIWARTLGAQKLLSPAGSPLIVTQTRGGELTALDAVSGRRWMHQSVSGEPYVSRDGAIVTTGRNGEPVWLFVPGISDR